MSDAAGSTYTPLNKPCPRCQGTLEREDNSRIANPSPVIKCGDCGQTWPSYAEVIVEAKAVKAAERGTKDPVRMVDIKKRLRQVKTGMRVSRNLAGGTRAVANLIGRIAAQVKQFEGHDSAAKIGEALEGIIDQTLLATEHVEDALKGNDPEVYDGKLEEETQTEEE